MSTLSLTNYQKSFLKSLELQGKSFNTVKNYKTDLNIFNTYLINKGRDLIINEVTITEISEYGEYLKNKYNSPNSIRRRVQALRIFFDYLIREEIFDHNPVKKMLVQPKVVDLPKPTPFKIAKALKEQLQSSADNEKGHVQLLAQRNIILFDLIYGGLKVSDIERLEHAHIILAENKYRVIISPDKRDPYTISLDKTFNDNYTKYEKLLEQAKNRDKTDFSKLMFNANPFKILSGGLSARGIEVIFKELSNEINHQITAKYLRQAAIFKWLSLGTPHSRIKEWMGVQPKYSLKPYLDLQSDEPHKYTYPTL
ncbi:MAG: site-specific integrase [Halobacteriovoraceae bacterium]|jgi:site-specific recombinase XerD|nr:site-specific integrase [Halobacteriovoraceae bacterium]